MRELLRLLESQFGDQPWWVYALAALVPICIFITVREMACWFLKTNKTVSRIARLESRVIRLEKAAKHLIDGSAVVPEEDHNLSKSRSSTKAPQGPAGPGKGQDSGPSEVDEEYTLD